jgi:hypothetical protein
MLVSAIGVSAVDSEDGEAMADADGDDAAVDAAVDAAIEEAGLITDPHRAIDWLSTFPQVVLLAVGSTP